MKKVILTAVLLLGTLQAEDVVHYDTKEVNKPQISKPNYPSTDLHTQK